MRTDLNGLVFVASHYLAARFIAIDFQKLFTREHKIFRILRSEKVLTFFNKSRERFVVLLMDDSTGFKIPDDRCVEPRFQVLRILTTYSHIRARFGAMRGGEVQCNLRGRPASAIEASDDLARVGMTLGLGPGLRNQTEGLQDLAGGKCEGRGRGIVPISPIVAPASVLRSAANVASEYVATNIPAQKATGHFLCTFRIWKAARGIGNLWLASTMNAPSAAPDTISERK